MLNENGIAEVKDFTTPRGNKPYPFKIDGDIFYAVADVPLGNLAELAKLRENIDLANINQLLDLFDEMLLDDSAALFKARLHDKSNPIGRSHIIPVLEWLMETYGFRPTQPSSPSSSPSVTDDSTSSVVGVRLEELTGSVSGPLDS